MSKAIHLDLPADFGPNYPDFASVLNDRFRRLEAVNDGTGSDSGSGGGGGVGGGGSGNPSALPVDYLSHVRVPNGVSRPFGEVLVEEMSILNFKGVDPTGAVDCASGFHWASDWVNAEPAGIVRRLSFPPGNYKYSEGLAFDNNVELVGTTGARLNYTGTGKAIRMGPDGLDYTSYLDHLHYSIYGCTFTGGASMEQGIYFNTFVTEPRVVGVRFENFGNAAAWGIFCQSSNWDTYVADNRWYSKPFPIVGRNFLRMNGYNAAGVSDFGQSQLRLFQNHLLNLDEGSGEGVYCSGVASMMQGNNIAGFAPNVRLAGRAVYTKVHQNYFEVIGKGTYVGGLLVAGSRVGNCIEYGDIAGHPDVGLWPQALSVSWNYCNIHNQAPISSVGHFMAPSSTGVGIQHTSFDGNIITENNLAVIKQNGGTSQNGNTANHNIVNGLPVKGNLHAGEGANSKWDGLDGDDEFVLNSRIDAQKYLVIRAGDTADQYRGVSFQDRNGLSVASLNVTPTGIASLVVNGHAPIILYTDGSMDWPGGSSISAAGHAFLAALGIAGLVEGAPLKVSSGVVASETGAIFPVYGGTGQASYTKGDLLGSPGGTSLVKLGVGADGKVLTADAGAALGFAWVTPIAVPVSSVFGRTGAVVAAAGDYDEAKGGTGQTTYTKGDLLTSPGGAALQRLNVGANGRILTADSGAALGVSWEPPPTGFSGTVAVRDSAGTGIKTFTIVNGLITGVA